MVEAPHGYHSSSAAAETICSLEHRIGTSSELDRALRAVAVFAHTCVRTHVFAHTLLALHEHDCQRPLVIPWSLKRTRGPKEEGYRSVRIQHPRRLADAVGRVVSTRSRPGGHGDKGL